MLVHDRDASALRIEWRAKINGFAVKDHRAGGWAVETGEELDAGALASAVFAKQRKNFTSIQRERGIAQGNRANEGLGSVIETDDGAAGANRVRGRHVRCVYHFRPEAALWLHGSFSAVA